MEQGGLTNATKITKTTKITKMAKVTNQRKNIRKQPAFNYYVDVLGLGKKFVLL